MQLNIKTFSIVVALCTLVAACSKVGNLPDTTFKNGTAPVLSDSAKLLNPLVSDSNSTALVLTWSNPHYATDSATQKYVIEIDSSGRNFAKETTIVVSGVLEYSFSAKQLNNILLAMGVAYNTAYKVDIRVTSSLGNNNQQLQSNVVTITFTTYVVPPKVAPPASKALFLVGSASSGGWNNPVPVPAQAFTMVDSVLYQGTFFLNGGQQYLLLPVDGDWSNKYAVANGTIPASGGAFGYNGGDPTYNTNFNGPATTGLYTITVDFQQGTFTVKQVQQYGILYVPGDYQGWTPASAAQLGSPKNDGNYDGYVNFPSGGTYQFKFTGEPDWNGSIWGDTAANGQSGVLSLGGGNNLQVPGAGWYEISANTTANTWSATAITSWSLIGSFAASNWSNDINMTYDANSNSWKGTITTALNDQFKFRANHAWTVNLGDAGGSAIGSLSYGGNNIGDPSKNFSVPPGTHTITLYLGNPGYYSYMIQ
jgi:hypothetical protein